MLRTRLWMGAILIGLAAGVLVGDQHLLPWSPFLLLLVLGLALLACVELLHLLGNRRPAAWLCYAAVGALIGVNWLPHLVPLPAPRLEAEPWPWIGGTFAAIVLAAFLVEMAAFREPGEAIVRVALTVWIAAYLGLLPSFLVQLRWMSDPLPVGGAPRGTLALALAVFVPKFCDTGAYFTGRLLGRHPLAPILSPKKTWEGAAGGLVASVLTAIGINSMGPALPGGLWPAAGFGVTVGLAGMMGDLAESLIKRDGRQKDASQVVPGFGGILDVVDSVVFAAPVAYWWFQ